jgi:hypothetical protein
LVSLPNQVIGLVAGNRYPAQVQGGSGGGHYFKYVMKHYRVKGSFNIVVAIATLVSNKQP